MPSTTAACRGCSWRKCWAATVWPKALFSCSPALPKLLLLAEQVQRMGCLQLEQVQLLVAPSQVACRHVVLEPQQLAEVAI